MTYEQIKKAYENSKSLKLEQLKDLFNKVYKYLEEYDNDHDNTNNKYYNDIEKIFYYLNYDIKQLQK